VQALDPPAEIIHHRATAAAPPESAGALVNGSINADSGTRALSQNRYNFWVKEDGRMPATEAPGPGAVLPNPLTSTA
jgi:hypothetical protein